MPARSNRMLELLAQRKDGLEQIPVLRSADAAIILNTMGDELDTELIERPLLHYAARQDVVFWTLERATG